MICGCRRRGRFVADNDQERGQGRTLGYAEERTHAELGHAVPVEDFDFQAVDSFGHGAGALDEDGGGKDVTGFVGEITGEVLAFADDVAAVEEQLKRLGRLGGDDSELHEFRTFVLLGLVGIHFVIADVDAFGDGGGEIAGGIDVVEREDEFGGAVSFGFANHGADEAAERGRVELIGLSGPGEHEAFGLEALGTVKDRRFERAAFGFAGGFDFGEPFRIGGANGVVARRGRAAFGFKLENDERVGFDGGEGLISKDDLHGIHLMGFGADESGAGFGVLLFGFFGGTFVVELLTTGNGDLYLHAAILEIHLRGDDGEALFPGFSVNFRDFLAVEEQFTFSIRKMVGDVAVRVFADVDVDEPCFPALNGGETVLQLHFSGAARLHFRPREGEASLKPFHEFVVMAGRAVITDDLKAGGGFGLNGAQNDSPALCTQRGRTARRHYLSVDCPWLHQTLILARDKTGTLCKMLNIRQLSSLLACATILWTSVVPAEAKTRKGDKYYKAGHQAELGRDFEKGLENYELALKEDPTDTAFQMAVRRTRFAAGAGRIDRAQKLREEGNVEEAMLEFERAFLIDPSSSLAVQEIRRTKAMLDYKRRQGAMMKEEEKGQTPTQIARKRSDEKIGTIQPVPELKPLSRQVTSLKMNNQNVKVLYETLGKLTGINVIWDPEYQQPSKNYNVDLTNTNLEEALDHLSVMTKTYWKALSSNTIFLTNDNITKRRDYEDNVVKVFYLQNITSVQELNEIATSVRSVTEIRRLYTYNAQNAVIARGTVDQVALVEKLLGDLDKPKAEVLVDVIVMETATGRTRDLAATLVTGETPGLRFNVSPTAAVAALPLGQLRSLGQNDFTVNLPGALLQAIMTDRNSKVRQTPQIRAADGQKAQLRIGEKVPTASGSFGSGIGVGGVGGGLPLVNTQFQYVEVGVVMDMVPRIHGDDEVSMHVEIEISNVVERIDIGGIKQPVIGQRKVIHDVRIREGEMNLIGGLVKTTSTRNVSGIPGLMQIPWLGRLFSSETVDVSDNELVIALVPHIVRTQEITPVNLRGVAAGNDQTVRLLYSNPEDTKAPVGTVPGGPVLTTPAIPDPVTPSKPTLPPAAPVKLTFQPEGVVTRAGSPVVVTLQVSEAVDLFQAPLQVKYDPKKLKLLAVTAGAFLSSDGGRVNFSHDDQAAKGEVAIQLSRVAGSPGLTGNGALLSLTFQTLESGTTQVAVLDSSMQNSKLQPVPAQKPSVGVEIR